jgi:hypothetical protein
MALDKKLKKMSAEYSILLAEMSVIRSKNTLFC